MSTQEEQLQDGQERDRDAQQTQTPETPRGATYEDGSKQEGEREVSEEGDEQGSEEPGRSSELPA